MPAIEVFSLEKENEIRNLWKNKKIPELVRQENTKQNKKFYFMDGPPYASGHIHMGTALNKILKDIPVKYWRMKGYHVFDRAGYDTHGVPIEHQIEKQHNFKNKQDIEKYGIKKFIDECKEFATKFINTMNSEFDNLGVWFDWKNPYLTLSNDYIEAIWYSFKKAHEKNLLYLGDYSVWSCTRCETAVAFNEIEYQKQTDNSIYVKFKVLDEENTYLIIWTTTPWTLPGNSGVMVHPDYEYDYVKMSNGEKWIIAKERVKTLMQAIEAGYSIEKTVKGKDLVGKSYENPCNKYTKLKKLENAYKVVLSPRYVNVEEGTGLVHCAPGYGKEDREVGNENNLPAICMVKINGVFDETGGKYEGKKARIVDTEIITDLENDNALVYKHPYSHDYPICWRCKTPLLTLSHPQWFFKISEIRNRMIELNEKIKWSPKPMQARFKNWLESLSDWPVSRSRYWGTPLPIWKCTKKECNSLKVIGSIKELEEVSGQKVKEIHKPEIDEISWKCKKCGKGKMQRTPEVLDVWFDSGVSSWAALGYPKNKKLFEQFWPADLNLEGTDQFRGWWNSQMILSTICFDKSPFKNVMVHGMVLGIGKVKMSKSLGNIIQPSEVIKKYNRDYMRYFFASNSKGEDIVFDWKAFEEINRFFNILWNSFNYVNLYLNWDLEKTKKLNLKELEIEDKWIISKFNSLSESVSNSIEKYVFAKAIEAIDKFVVEELSRTYIKMIRDRVSGENKKSKQSVQTTLNYVIFNLIKLMAPITPHLTEYMYQNIKTDKMPETIHLHSFPEANTKLIDKELEKEMQLTKEIIQYSANLREENKLRLRWPLKELLIKTKKPLNKTLKIITRMTNVKKARIVSDKPLGKYSEKQIPETEIYLYLNTQADNELKDEWEFRELTRKIQSQRKKQKLNPNNIVGLNISCSDSTFLDKFKSKIEKATNTKITIKDGKKEKVLKREFFLELQTKAKKETQDFQQN